MHAALGLDVLPCTVLVQTPAGGLSCLLPEPDIPYIGGDEAVDITYKT